MRLPVLMCTAFAALYGCGSSKSASDTPATTKSELEGTWNTACGLSDPGSTSYDVITESYTGTAFKGLQQSYSDAACTTKTFSLRATGTFTSGTAVTTPTGAKTLDIKPTGVYFTLNSATYVDQFNGTAEGSTKICGGGWVINQEKQVTDVLCKDSADFATIEDTNFGIYKITGSQLTEGESGDKGTATDASSAAKRPAAFSARSATKS